MATKTARKGRPRDGKLQIWMIPQRELVHDGAAIAKALDDNLKRWPALSRYLNDDVAPIDNNQIEQQIQPRASWTQELALRRGVRSSKRAAALISLIQTAKRNGHDLYAYLKDIMARLST